jgi:exodeoxyribonuclease VII large subunit
VISSVGHHTDRTLLDDVAAVCCSTPTHAADAAVPIDCRAARADLLAHGRRLQNHGRRAILDRARSLAHLARSPTTHVARHRRHLHQMLRELRASARRTTEDGRSRADAQRLTLVRTAARARTSDAARRRAELDRLRLALAAHDPARTLARGYAMVSDPAGEPLTSAAAARSAGELELRFHDGTVPAQAQP